ncbi:SKP1-like protein 11 [Lasiodiplodia hormozganensis]|uniref:SKP1-like protein 11 n=1 Tax=Lasiodiplodia hormozganensis TaxID=869390 RepID=A0AA39XQL4_9PEZI|nr:SKP1-like protein 11 [Lasiodiplodia hormozganensis]
MEEKVNERVMHKVLDWCKRYRNDGATGNNDCSTWNEEFIQVDDFMLIEIIRASNYLDVSALLDLSCKTAASRIPEKSLAGIKTMFNIRDYQIPRHNGLGSSGYPETRDILPFVTTFQPSLAGALLVRQCLECALPSELVNPIVSLGYSPWVVKRKVENVDYYADDAVNGSMAGLYLATEPIPYPDPSTGIHRVVPKRIIFQTRAADRGVCLGPNETTADIDSWFEASNLQPLPGNLKGDDLNEALKESQDGEDGFQEHFNSVSVAAEDLKEKGWELVKTDDGEVSWTVRNNIKEKKKIRAYKFEWSSGGYTEAEKRRGLEKGKGEEFLEKLKPGSIVVLWARAEEQGSINFVRAAAIEIEFEVP